MAKQRFMLDTNTVSYIIKGKPVGVRHQLCRVAMSCVCISTITEAELLRGVARKPEAKGLALAVREFLLRLEILPWDSAAAASYATLRTACENEGKSLATMDMLIAAHCVSVAAVLISNDQAFTQIKHLVTLQDWTCPIVD